MMIASTVMASPIAHISKAISSPITTQYMIIHQHYYIRSETGALVITFNTAQKTFNVAEVSRYGSACMGGNRHYEIKDNGQLQGAWGTKATFSNGGETLSVSSPSNWNGTWAATDGDIGSNPCE